MRTVFDWNIGSRSLALGKRTLVMGVVNVTPDSFSDGGDFLDPDKALEHALRLLDDGAEIIDIGGESTRPGARVNPSTTGKAADTSKPVSEKEERDRVLSIIRRGIATRPAIPAETV